MANDKGYNGKKTRAIKFRQYQHKQALQLLLRKKSQTHWNSNIDKIQRKIKKQQEEYQEQNVNWRITTSRNWKMSQYRQRERNSNGHQKLEKKGPVAITNTALQHLPPQAIEFHRSQMLYYTTGTSLKYGKRQKPS